MMKSKSQKPCGLCGGTGEYIIPARQEAGQIVDEQVIKCPCADKEEVSDLYCALCVNPNGTHISHCPIIQDKQPELLKAAEEFTRKMKSNYEEEK